MPRERSGDRGVGREGGPFVAALLDLQNVDLLCAEEERQGVEHGARRLASGLPGDDDVAADLRVAADVGHDKHGAAALQRQPLGEVQQRREVPVGIGLPGDDQVGGAAVIHDDGREIDMRHLHGAPFGHERLVGRHAREDGGDLLGLLALGGDHRAQHFAAVGDGIGGAGTIE